MQSRNRSIMVLALTVLMALGSSGPVAGQAKRMTLTAMAGGLVEPDLVNIGPNEEGIVAFGALRLGVPITSFLVFEPGLEYFSDTSESGRRSRYLIGEAQVQLMPVDARVRPYLGVGVGGSWLMEHGGRVRLINGGNAFWLTLTAAVGIEVDVGRRWAVRSELRSRSIDPWIGASGELGIGISRSLF